MYHTGAMYVASEYAIAKNFKDEKLWVLLYLAGV